MMNLERQTKEPLAKLTNNLERMVQPQSHKRQFVVGSDPFYPDSAPRSFRAGERRLSSSFKHHSPARKLLWARISRKDLN